MKKWADLVALSIGIGAVLGIIFGTALLITKAIGGLGG